VVYEGSALATAKTLGLSGYTYGVGGGADESSSQTIVSYTITNIPSFITLWKSGGAQVLINNTLTLAELQGLMYKTIAYANGVATNISWKVTDNGGGSTDTVSQVVVLEGFDLLAGYTGNLATQLTALKNAGILVV